MWLEINTMLLPKLRFTWGIVLAVGLVIAIADIWFWQNEALALAGSVMAGFASSAYFSTSNQFFIRGADHKVYLIQNRFLLTFHELANPETFNSFGGIWHEILHVSGRENRFLSRFAKEKLNIKEADLYYLPSLDGKDSYFAILLGIRYGISHIDTVERIWRDYKTRRKEGSKEILNKFKPGRDLTAVDYWPKNYQ